MKITFIGGGNMAQAIIGGLLRKGFERTVSIVGQDEVDSTRNRISWVSPVARALTRSREGDVIALRTPAGLEELEVIEVRYVELPE